jgi:hypothetical protein
MDQEAMKRMPLSRPSVIMTLLSSQRFVHSPETLDLDLE